MENKRESGASKKVESPKEHEHVGRRHEKRIDEKKPCGGEDQICPCELGDHFEGEKKEIFKPNDGEDDEPKREQEEHIVGKKKNH